LLRQGFTLIETLIVVAIIGLLMAIGIPMWLNSVNRAKQTSSVADMREIASAWEARAADYRSYSAAGATFTMPPMPLTGTDVQALIQPTYIRKMPFLDGWRRPFEFAVDAPASATTYAIRSLGRDGQPDVKTTYTIGQTSRFDCDIVYSSGAFIVYPQGAQKN
jgi:type II secretion system protein G